METALLRWLQTVTAQYWWIELGHPLCKQATRTSAVPIAGSIALRSKTTRHQKPHTAKLAELRQLWRTGEATDLQEVELWWTTFSIWMKQHFFCCPVKHLCRREMRAHEPNSKRNELRLFLEQMLLVKKKLLVVTRKLWNTQCFQNASLPKGILYRCNKTAWRTVMLLEENVRVLECNLAKEEKREVIFVVDNCRGHLKWTLNPLHSNYCLHCNYCLPTWCLCFNQWTKRPSNQLESHTGKVYYKEFCCVQECKQIQNQPFGCGTPGCGTPHDTSWTMPGRMCLAVRTGFRILLWGKFYRAWGPWLWWAVMRYIMTYSDLQTAQALELTAT